MLTEAPPLSSLSALGSSGIVPTVRIPDSANPLTLMGTEPTVTMSLLAIAEEARA